MEATDLFGEVVETPSLPVPAVIRGHRHHKVGDEPRVMPNPFFDALLSRPKPYSVIRLSSTSTLILNEP